MIVALRVEKEKQKRLRREEDALDASGKAYPKVPSIGLALLSSLLIWDN